MHLSLPTKTVGAAALLAATLHTAPALAVEEVPFITTPDNVTLAMLEIAGVGRRDHVIDLGSGDGRIVITAARRFGASGLGVEIDPALVERSNANAAKAGVAARVQFREQDLFKTDLAPASVITMYLLPDVNLQLRPALLALKPGTRLVSHDWDMADWAPDRTLTLDVPDKKIGLDKRSRVHLWVVPAKVEGLWCGPRGAALQLSQQFQRVQGRAGPARDSVQAWGHLDGTALHLAARGATLRLSVDGDQARVTAASGPWAGWRSVRFTRASGATCSG
jgi:SAM-dependent methyltransferase